jgi:hypothetical protein
LVQRRLHSLAEERKKFHVAGCSLHHPSAQEARSLLMAGTVIVPLGRPTSGNEQQGIL